VPFSLNRIFCRRITGLSEKYEQLEMDLRRSVLDLRDANYKIERLQFEAVDRAAEHAAEMLDQAEMLRESELARQQLELDLTAAKGREDNHLGIMRKLERVVRDLESRLNQLSHPPRDPVTGRFVGVAQ
jgi:hypothetical protein